MRTGFGFRRFPGLLHMEIIQQRSKAGILTWCKRAQRDLRDSDHHRRNAVHPQSAKVPDSGTIDEFRQPIVKVNVLPVEGIGPVMQLCTDRRGVYVHFPVLSPAGHLDVQPAAGRRDLRHARQAQERHGGYGFRWTMS